MGGRIALALAIHNHQPVGNFGWVFEDVFGRAYEPLLQALERHPGVRLSLHYTGPLIEWIRGEHPAFLDRLQTFVEREQVEVLGGGYYEPVLASLPERDRHGQLVRMADEIERLVGRRPRGAWLAERVWEPQLPAVLADAGYEWTILDDNHFRAAAIAEDAMWGAYVTEDQGRPLRVFGTEQGLRYRIPFGAPEDVVAHLRANATDDGHRLGFMGDDGEKFGAWPGTYEHCWGRNRWIDRFFGLLEDNASWLTTVTPSSWLDREPPVGRTYVPTASYVEMGEWALPPADSNALTALVKRASEEDLPERRFLRGGFWRNFQVRYREINDVHKQMLRASVKVAAMPDGPDKEAALDHLYRGQSNDCYWHGLFGGIYIVHMRLATAGYLIAAEDLADQARLRDEQPEMGAAVGTPPPDGSALLDTDMDGVLEAFLASAGQILVVDLAEGAAIGTWDLRATRLALASVMRRRLEAYHATLVAYERANPPDTADAAPDGTANSAATGAPKTIHETIAVKEPGLSRLLVYDRHERRSALLHVVPSGTAVDAFRRQDAVELGDVVDDPYRVAALADRELIVERDGLVSGQPVRVRKVFRLSGGRLDPSLSVDVDLEHRGAAPIAADVVLEWNVDLAGGGGNPAAYYAVPPDGSARGGTDEAAVRRYTHDSSEHPGVLSSVSFGNTFEGAYVHATLTPPADVAWYPVETVSNSEAGFERQYQGSCLLLRWPLALRPGEARTIGVRFDVTSSRDRRAEQR